MASGGAFAGNVDQSYIFSNSTPSSIADLAILDPVEMQETKGEALPVLVAYIATIFGADVALQAYYFGVYVPAIEKYRAELKRQPKPPHPQ